MTEFKDVPLCIGLVNSLQQTDIHFLVAVCMIFREICPVKRSQSKRPISRISGNLRCKNYIDPTAVYKTSHRIHCIYTNVGYTKAQTGKKDDRPQCYPTSPSNIAIYNPFRPYLSSYSLSSVPNNIYY